MMAMADSLSFPGRGSSARSSPEALRQVLAQRPFVLAFLVSLLRDFALAEEILKDLCVAASTGRAEVPAGGDVAAWARQAARRRAMAVLRARAAQGAPVPTEETVDRIEQAIAELAATEGRWEQRKAVLRECVRALPAHLRQVLELRYAHELSAAHIAARLGLAGEQARAALCQARDEIEAEARRRLAAKGTAT